MTNTHTYKLTIKVGYCSDEIKKNYGGIDTY